MISHGIRTPAHLRLSIAAAHFLRLASADRAARLKIGELLQLPAPPEGPRTTLSSGKKENFVEDLRKAVVASFFSSWVQGLQVIARQSEKEGWHVSLQTCLNIWRAGCIIASDGLAEILGPVVKDFDETASSSPPSEAHVYKLFSVERDACLTTLSASLEWVKYVGAGVLPTVFMEAHAYERWDNEAGRGGVVVKKGSEH
ncbi:6-phosphogluconate dehydrogenase [Irpex lacteus]|nr:6-phosphogluconate dehydrogenase [Irpex lacteus]